jgi:hypothetical protein
MLLDYCPSTVELHVTAEPPMRSPKWAVGLFSANLHRPLISICPNGRPRFILASVGSDRIAYLVDRLELQFAALSIASPQPARLDRVPTVHILQGPPDRGVRLEQRQPKFDRPSAVVQDTKVPTRYRQVQESGVGSRPAVNASGCGSEGHTLESGLHECARALHSCCLGGPFYGTVRHIVVELHSWW